MSVGGEGARGDGLLRWFCVGGIGGYAGYVTLKRGVFPLVFSDEDWTPGIILGFLYTFLWSFAALSCLWMFFCCQTLKRPFQPKPKKEKFRSDLDVALWMRCDLCQQDVYRPVEHSSFASLCINCGSQAHKCYILYFFYSTLSLYLSAFLLLSLPFEAYQTPLSFWSMRVFVLCFVLWGLTLYMTARTLLLFFFASLNVTPLEWAILTKEYKYDTWKENGTPFPPSPSPLSLSPFPPFSKLHNFRVVFGFSPCDPRWLMPWAVGERFSSPSL